MRLVILAGAAVLAWFSGTGANAQMAPQAPVHGRVVAAEIKKLLDAHYVLPDARPKFDAVLAKGIAAGRYDVSDPEELVQRINADLHEVTPDKHLNVAYDPATSKQLAAEPPRSGGDDAPPTPAEIAGAERHNSGLVQTRLLPGNIRYLETEGFIWAGDSTEQAYDDAMRFLAGGDAVIIDMRKNGGGSPEAVRYLVSHFLAPNTPLMTFCIGSKPGQHTTALATTRAPRMVGKPLYVLTSGGTASAAEEFTGHVAGYKLGELIGENTAGAGFRNEFYPLPDGMMISISVGQAILASTGKGWEGVGFAPTTKVDVDKALQVAQVHALRRLAESADPTKKAGLEAAAAMLSAETDPVKTALPLSAYAGVFGDRTIALESGALTFQRQGAPRHVMVAIDPNQFTFEDDPMSRVRFTVAGDSVTELELLRADGTTAKAVRTQ
jgi:hypothetical protein